MWVISSSCRNKAGGISVACLDIDMFSNSTLVHQHQHRCIRIISVISSSCRNKAGGISVACFDKDKFSNSSLISISITIISVACFYIDMFSKSTLVSIISIGQHSDLS